MVEEKENIECLYITNQGYKTLREILNELLKDNHNKNGTLDIVWEDDEEIVQVRLQ